MAMCHSVLILVFYVFVCEMWSLDDAFTLICCSIFLKKIGLNFRGFIPFWFKWPSRVWLFWFRLWSCEWAWRVHLVLILAPRGDFDLTLIWFCLVLAPSDLWSDFVFFWLCLQAATWIWLWFVVVFFFSSGSKCRFWLHLRREFSRF